MTRLLIKLISFILLGCLCIILLATGVGHVLPTEDEIVYSANLDKRDYQIYLMAFARQISVPLTRGQANNTNPNWSPDGQQIVFGNDRSGENTLYIMDAEGKNVHPLTDTPIGNQDNPMWSPDGLSVVYIFIQRPDHVHYYPQLMLFGLRTRTNRYLTNNIDDALAPYWSPDGTQIAFIRLAQDRLAYDIVSVTIKTGEVQNLTATSRDESNPAWSPDGRTIAHEGNSPNGIYLFDISRKESTLLYSPTLSSTINGWSPDGQFILYTARNKDQTQHLFELNVADCLQHPTTCTSAPLFPEPKAGSYTSPHWRPHPA